MNTTPSHAPLLAPASVGPMGSASAPPPCRTRREISPMGWGIYAVSGSVVQAGRTPRSHPRRLVVGPGRPRSSKGFESPRSCSPCRNMEGSYAFLICRMGACDAVPALASLDQAGVLAAHKPKRQVLSREGHGRKTAITPTPAEGPGASTAPPYLIQGPAGGGSRTRKWLPCESGRRAGAKRTHCTKDKTNAQADNRQPSTGRGPGHINKRALDGLSKLDSQAALRLRQDERGLAQGGVVYVVSTQGS